MSIEFLKLCISTPKTLLIVVLEKLSPLFSTKQYIKLRWRIVMGKPLNLKNPQTFNEKLNWLKLYDHNPIYTTMVDKYRVKQYVAECIGAEHVVPLLGVWNQINDIDWNNLPTRFVIKCSHDCGGMVICKDKSKLNIVRASKLLQKCMRVQYYWKSREWPYKNVDRKVFAEAYLEDEYGELRDYKLFCFNGKVRCFKIDYDRFKKHRANYYSPDGVLLPFGEEVCPPDYNRKVEIPSVMKEIVEMAEILSKNIPFVRVDFYCVNCKVFFGEMTFFPGGGIGKFVPEEWDEILGSWITLPTNNKR